MPRSQTDGRTDGRGHQREKGSLARVEKAMHAMRARGGGRSRENKGTEGREGRRKRKRDLT